MLVLTQHQWCCRLAVVTTKHAVLAAPTQGGEGSPAWTHRDFLPQAWNVIVTSDVSMPNAF